jgi:hypothetical protein
MTDDRRWEYQFVRVVVNAPTDAATLSALGAQGWRVVHVATLPEDRGVVQVLVERELIPPAATRSRV